MRWIVAIGLVFSLSTLATADDGLETFIEEAREVCVSKYPIDASWICAIERFRPYATDFYRLRMGEDIEKYSFEPETGIGSRDVAIACGEATSKGGRINVHYAMRCVEQKVENVRQRLARQRTMSPKDWWDEESVRLFARARALWCPDPLIGDPICLSVVAQRHFTRCAEIYRDQHRETYRIDSAALWACVVADYVKTKSAERNGE